ncbi:hypothetical protein C8R46DRAFT_1271674 [Mycena filopes]|nr:hypothetical protein C8R46DRAFT_1271674 [Mycena filopes]
MHLSLYSIATLLSAAISTALPAFLAGGQGTITSPAAGLIPENYCEPFLPSSPSALTERNLRPIPISDVRFHQDAAVSARLIVNWINPSDMSRGWMWLGGWLAIGVDKSFNLQEAGVRNGSIVNFSSCVAAVGEYESDEWFTLEHSAHLRAAFEQTGTAFMGWFEYLGLENWTPPSLLPGLDYESRAVASISHVKFRQDAAVSAYLIVKWLNPDDATPGSKDLGPWKVINTEETFSLQDHWVHRPICGPCKMQANSMQI